MNAPALPFRGVTTCGDICALLFNRRVAPGPYGVQTVAVVVQDWMFPVAIAHVCLTLEEVRSLNAERALIAVLRSAEKFAAEDVAA